MTNLTELQEALDNRPALSGHYKESIDEWFEDFARKFAAYRASLEVPIGKKELSLRKRAEVWWIACQASRKGRHGCFVTNHHEEWKCKDCQDLLVKLFSEEKVLPVDVWLTKHAKTLSDLLWENNIEWNEWLRMGVTEAKQIALAPKYRGKWVSVPEIQPRLMKLVQERDDNKLLIIQAITKLRAKEEQLEGKVLIDRKQLSDLMKRQPLPEAFRWISDFKSQYQHWTKKLKELLEK